MNDIHDPPSLRETGKTMLRLLWVTVAVGVSAGLVTVLLAWFVMGCAQPPISPATTAEVAAHKVEIEQCREHTDDTFNECLTRNSDASCRTSAANFFQACSREVDKQYGVTP